MRRRQRPVANIIEDSQGQIPVTGIDRRRANLQYITHAQLASFDSECLRAGQDVARDAQSRWRRQGCLQP
jgi:hypothetical protein